jgi:hypothetical protein
VSHSSEYIKYVSDLAAGKTCIVDLCGTGWSLTSLLEATGSSNIEIFLVHLLKNEGILNHYRSLRQINAEPNPEFITQRGNNIILEALNNAGHEMVTDVVQVGKTFVPQFIKNLADERQRTLAAEAERAILLASDALSRVEQGEILEYLGRVSNSDVERLYDGVTAAEEVTREISAKQLAENSMLEKHVTAPKR